MPVAGWKKMTSDEIRLAQGWYSSGTPPSTIAHRLGRNKSALTRLLVKQVPRRDQGRPRALSRAQVDLLKRKLDELVRKADCKYTVTIKMLKSATKAKASERSIARALHAENIYFRKLREKPKLTPDDVKARFAFAQKFHKKPKSWWAQQLHASIDGKHFQAYLNADQRARAAQHATYGAYRAPGKGLARGYVKPKKTLRSGGGVKNILVIAAVGHGKVIMWHNVPDGRWSGQAAANMYAGPLRRSLAATYPGKRKFTILEDNDPTGFKSTKGVEAKSKASIGVLEIPRRSPDLNVLDYAVWKEVNKRLRKQEQKWPSHKRETRIQHRSRLHRTAKNLPAAFINSSVEDMRRRCGRLLAAKGGFFQEGGGSSD